MAYFDILDTNIYLIDDNVNSEHILHFDLGVPISLNKITITGLVDNVDNEEWMYYDIYYSFDNITYYHTYNTISDANPIPRTFHSSQPYIVSQNIYVKIKFNNSPYSGVETNFLSFNVTATDLIPDSITISEPEFWDVGLPEFQGYVFEPNLDQWVFPHIINQTTGGTDPAPDPVTITAIVSGNVKKLGLPFELLIHVMSIGLDAELLGSTKSDPLTGDYSVDIAPHDAEVLVIATPDYGKAFSAALYLSAGAIIHPTTPNKHVYVAQNDGLLGSVEPNYPESGLLNSGGVSLLTVPLHRPLANGFVKPTVTPI